MDPTRRVVATDAILLTPDGTIITGWIGAVPEDQVLQLAARDTAS